MAIWYLGIRFLPTDDELFFHYLMPRLNQEPLPDPNVIRDCDVYGGGDPWEIFNKDRDEKNYVFTMLKKKNKSRVDRTAGSGTWKGEQSYKIKGSQGEVVGYKKLFTFEPKASSSMEDDKVENGHWIMYEYSKHPYNVKECVLCVISNKYVEEGSKKMCRNLQGRMQLEEENQRAKKACPPRDDDGGDDTAHVDSLSWIVKQVNDDGWIDLLMDMDIDTAVPSDHFSCSYPFANPPEDDTDAMLGSTLGGPYSHTWDPTTLHQQRIVAESQDEDEPVPLTWADKFLSV